MIYEDQDQPQGAVESEDAELRALPLARSSHSPGTNSIATDIALELSW